MNLDEICICTHTFEVHFGGACSKVDCPCKQFVEIGLAPEIFQELLECRKELLGASAYLETCDPAIIVENLDTFTAGLKRRLASVEVVLHKVENE